MRREQRAHALEAAAVATHALRTDALVERQIVHDLERRVLMHQSSLVPLLLLEQQLCIRLLRLL